MQIKKKRKINITTGICHEQHHISFSTGLFCDGSDAGIRGSTGLYTVVDMIHSFSTCLHSAVSV